MEEDCIHLIKVGNILGLSLKITLKVLESSQISYLGSSITEG